MSKMPLRFTLCFPHFQVMGALVIPMVTQLYQQMILMHPQNQAILENFQETMNPEKNGGWEGE